MTVLIIQGHSIDDCPFYSRTLHRQLSLLFKDPLQKTVFLFKDSLDGYPYCLGTFIDHC